MKLFISQSNKKNLNHHTMKRLQERCEKEDMVLAIGGGSIIDEAKIYGMRFQKKVIAVPTTGAGASETSHAVVWTDKGKSNILCEKPMTQFPIFEINLTPQARENTYYDILCHCMEAGRSMDVSLSDSEIALSIASAITYRIPDNVYVHMGIIAGKLVEKYGTNIYHALSYPLTYIYHIPHGEALGIIYNSIHKKEKFPDVYDKNIIAEEALEYEKIHQNANFGILTKKRIVGLLW